MSVIDAYIAELRQKGAKSASLLLPGMPGALATLKKELPKLSPPTDLGELWKAFDGAAGENELLDDLWLDGTFYFFSVAEAVEDYRICDDLRASDSDFEEYWPTGYLPIATPGDGSRLLVDCVAGSKTHGSVFELFHGIGIARSAASIEAYFKTARAWLDKGVMTVTADGKLDIDHERASEIARQMNPDCENWADDTGTDQ